MKAYECFKQDCIDRLVSSISTGCKCDGLFEEKRKHILVDKNQRYQLIMCDKFQSAETCRVLFGGTLKFHQFSHHLNSSQIFCINVFAPLMTGDRRSDNMKALLRQMGVNLEGDVVYSDSENITKMKGTTMLEYKPAEKNDRTNFDFHVVTTRDGDTVFEEVFFEIKYTESEFGRASYNVDESKKGKEWERFYKDFCRKSRYLSEYSMEDFYEYFQINRNIGHITRDGRKFVVFMFPYSNPSLRFPYTDCSRMRRVKVCFSEQLGKMADDAFKNDRELKEYYHKLVQRYFGSAISA